jgi:hypothetical protein
MEIQYHDAPQGENTYLERDSSRKENQGIIVRNSDAQMQEEIRNRYVVHQGAG